MIWLDAHLSPRVAKYITEELGHPASTLRDLDLQTEEDTDLFEMAAKEKVVFISKDKESPKTKTLPTSFNGSDRRRM